VGFNPRIAAANIHDPDGVALCLITGTEGNGDNRGNALRFRCCLLFTLKKKDEPRNRTKDHEKMGISIATPFTIPVKPMLIGIPAFLWFFELFRGPMAVSRFTHLRGRTIMRANPYAAPWGVADREILSLWLRNGIGGASGNQIDLVALVETQSHGHVWPAAASPMPFTTLAGTPAADTIRCGCISILFVQNVPGTRCRP
jgi:hypothetical protein